MGLVEAPANYLVDFGVPAVVGASTVSVLFDKPAEDILTGHVQTENYSITYLTSDLPALSFGSTVVIAGVTYSVLSTKPIADGIFSKAHLEAV